MIIDSVIDHINISKHIPLAGSGYIKLSKQLDYPRKGPINIQNIDDSDCIKWFLVRYLHPVDHHPRQITKTHRYFVRKLDFKNIQFSVKGRDIHKTEKKNSISINVFGYENKDKHAICIKKMSWRKTCWFVINRRRREETLCSDQRLQYIHV